jgi:hypothetical protein
MTEVTRELIEARIEELERYGECHCDSWNMSHSCKTCKRIAALRSELSALREKANV